ncbi:DUF6401 family natural product biosynthesis protein [Jiangella asiatica]|uniref:Uncharacterized protein n=1 Tax=Jiangella asiatica TaxID=2530372 RepID=A0A4R5DMT4_9ACTN|nr:DUF6401 family natural product biosynthesis protein [Jiangella asiatica]TDE12215.1 hypothetical protein E1269_07970 [Jiangella asiatica]
MNWLAPRRRRTAAQRELASLADRLGMADLSEWPAGRLAAVDQHAAAVRDILLLSGEDTGPAELANYARGIEDVAQERGRAPGTPNWDAPDWVSLRLAGVSILAMADPAMASIAGGDVDPLASS